MPKADNEYEIHVSCCLRWCSKRRRYNSITIEIGGCLFHSNGRDTRTHMTNPIFELMLSEEYRYN
jgi:hypothetical protein